MLFIVSSHLAVHGVINTADVVWKDGSAVNYLFSSGLMGGGGGLGAAGGALTLDMPSKCMTRNISPNIRGK